MFIFLKGITVERSPDRCALVGVMEFRMEKSLKDPEMNPTLDMGYHQRKPIPDKYHQVKNFPVPL